MDKQDLFLYSDDELVKIIVDCGVTYIPSVKVEKYVLVDMAHAAMNRIDTIEYLTLLKVRPIMTRNNWI